ncbi:MAG: hypothetical protein KDA63_04615 [Planctomycetales bacterium]|nr:hypothetical protein [Planctomycetales bacterium]
MGKSDVETIVHRDRRVRRDVFVGAVLGCIFLLWGAFRQLGFAWANGTAFVVILLVAALWLVITLVSQRRLRFGIRGILVLTALAAVLFAALGQRWYEVQSRRTALAAIEATGAEVKMQCWVTRDAWQPPGWLVSSVGVGFFADRWSLQISGTNIDNEALAKCDLNGYSSISINASNFNDDGAAALDGLTELASLSLNDVAMTDKGLAHLTTFRNQADISGEGLKHLAGLDRLHSVHLIRTRVTGEGLMYLRDANRLTTLWLTNSMITREGAAGIASLESLRELNLSGSYIGEAEVPYLVSLKNLRTLNLDGTDVTDQSMPHLAQLPYLEHLALGQTLVSDAGLVHLEELRKLKTVSLNDTNVTPEGVTQLQQALPACKVSFTVVQSPPASMFRRREN